MKPVSCEFNNKFALRQWALLTVLVTQFSAVIYEFQPRAEDAYHRGKPIGCYEYIIGVDYDKIDDMRSETLNDFLA